jgi:hypothetical protein
MMFTNFGTLKTAIADELARSDLTAAIPNWVGFAESWIAREVNLLEGDQVDTGTFTTGQDYLALPSGYKSGRMLEITYGQAQTRLLEIVSFDMLAAVRVNDTSGVPRAATFHGNNVYVAPTPAEDFAYRLFYKGFPAKLTLDADTNQLITDAPDLLYYASLLYSAPYIGNDERLGLWVQMRNDALANLKRFYWNQKASGGIMRIRTDVGPGRDAHR